MLIYEREALALAEGLPQFLSLLNYATTRLRGDHLQWNRRLGARGEDHAVKADAGLKWHDGTALHQYLFEGLPVRDLAWEFTQGGKGDFIFCNGVRVFVSRRRPSVDEEGPEQIGLQLSARNEDLPEWVFKVSMRKVDRIAVPPAKRTLADGWPDPDVLARPAIPEDEPITMIDYIREAVLYDRRHVAVRLPVFSRSVVLGRRGRMQDCWSAKGVRRSASEM